MFNTNCYIVGQHCEDCVFQNDAAKQHCMLMLILSCNSFTGCLLPVVFNTNYVC